MFDDLRDDPEFQELVYGYLDYLQRSVADAWSSLDRKKYNDLRQFGHNLMGTAASYHFDRLTDLGKKMNLAAKKRDGKAIRKLIHDIEDLVEEYRDKEQNTG